MLCNICNQELEPDGMALIGKENQLILYASCSNNHAPVTTMQTPQELEETRKLLNQAKEIIS